MNYENSFAVYDRDVTTLVSVDVTSRLAKPTTDLVDTSESSIVSIVHLGVSVLWSCITSCCSCDPAHCPLRPDLPFSLRYVIRNIHPV